MILNGETTFHLEGGKTVSLTPSLFATGGNFIAKGGEANIYRKGDKIFKLYYKAGKENQPCYIPEDKLKKLKLLRFFNSPYIISPKGFIYLNSKDQDPIGFWMYYAEGEPLARLFTKSKKAELGLTDALVCVLVERMRQAVALAHAYRCIVVDHNELNWVVNIGPYGPEPRIMDVDSWMTRDWPAKAVHPLVEDFSANGKYTQESDWFTWGIVTFQLFTGIHPYKGELAGYASNETQRRMKDHASVFSKGIKLNPAVKDFSCIPKELLNWYKMVFQDGYRGEPPALHISTDKVDILPKENRQMVPTIVPQPKKSFLRKLAEQFFVIEDEVVLPNQKPKSWGRKFAELFVEYEEEVTVDTSSLPREMETIPPSSTTDTYSAIFTEGVTVTDPNAVEDVLTITEAVQIKSDRFDFACLYHHRVETAKKVFPCGIILTKNNRLYCLVEKKFLVGQYSDACEVRAYANGCLVIDIVQGKHTFSYLKKEDMSVLPITTVYTATIQQITWFERKLFGVTDTFLAELVFDEQSLSLSLSKEMVYTYKPNTITWYQGMGIRRTEKRAMMVCITRNGIIEKRVDELILMAVQHAVSGHMFIAVSGTDEHGRMIKREFSFTPDYATYTTWRELGASDVAIFERGTVASIEKDEILEIYVPASGAVRLVTDPILKKEFPLFVWEDKEYMSKKSLLLMILEGRVYSMKMRDTSPRAG